MTAERSLKPKFSIPTLPNPNLRISEWAFFTTLQYIWVQKYIICCMMYNKCVLSLASAYSSISMTSKVRKKVLNEYIKYIMYFKCQNRGEMILFPQSLPRWIIQLWTDTGNDFKNHRPSLLGFTRRNRFYPNYMYVTVLHSASLY